MRFRDPSALVLLRAGGPDADAAVQACLASLWPGVARVAPMDDVLTRAEGLLARSALRAADALQLAALVWAVDRPTGHEVVCLDDRLRDAATRDSFVILP